MKKLNVLGISLAFALSSASVMAEGDFQALSKMPNAEAATLTSLTSTQLSAVEGTYYFPVIFDFDSCYGCANIAQFSQSNVNIGGNAYQSNSVYFSQSIN